jgi:osmotically-inducible protein OsmY
MMQTHHPPQTTVADRDLEQRVRNYLFGYKMPTLRSIEVEAAGDTVLLRGRVSCYYHKQLCLHCCHRVAGVRTIVDEITVVETEDNGTWPVETHEAPGRNAGRLVEAAQRIRNPR